ncbi:tryptophan dimethylallyltransferase family protein [Streptomyces sp. NPDC101166]|uniref:tryptophan dimethylallyltransferase family protein n=1 Tax=Streptomyces sp. NPDC101166 TaxID=3366120 RepID=UPI003818CA7C
MTAPALDGLSGAATSTLGSLTSAQLARLCGVAGLSPVDAKTYAAVLAEALGPVAERPLHLPPPSRTFLSDDHTPVEYSLSFLPDGACALRVLIEPGCGAPGLAQNGRVGLDVIRDMAYRWGFSTDRLDELEDLFLPPAPQGALALWCALELRPGGVPMLKVYLNPAANGAEHCAETVREALDRLGHGQAFASLPPADGYPFLALDLGDWESPRVKVYLRHDRLSVAGAAGLSRMEAGPGPAEIERFLRTAAGLGDSVFGGDPLDVFETGPDGEERLTGRPVLTCHAFTKTGVGRPTGFTLHVPVRGYAAHDGESLSRATDLLRAYGMDPSPLPKALAAVTSRRLQDGVGLVAYLALAHQQGRPPRVTTYISAEAYDVRPPVTPRPVTAATATG